MKKLTQTVFAHVVAAVVFMGNTVACAPTWTVPAINGTFVAPETYTVCISLPESTLADANAAVEMWDKSLQQWRHLVAVDGLKEPCSFVVSEVDPSETDDPNVLAWTSKVGGSTIYMVKGRYEKDVEGVLLHELGHAFGAQHFHGTLMNEVYQQNLYVCPDETTVAQVAAYNHISLKLLSWCVP